VALGLDRLCRYAPVLQACLRPAQFAEQVANNRCRIRSPPASYGFGPAALLG